MWHALVKGAFLLLGIAGGIFFIYSRELISLVKQPEVKPILVANSKDAVQGKRQVLKGTLFGGPKAIRAPITESSLGFVLKGTVPSNNPEKSFAIIQLQSKKERVATVGDELVSGVILESVFNDHVVILRNGKREKISFPVVKRNSLIASQRVNDPKNDASVVSSIINNITPISGQSTGSTKQEKMIQSFSNTLQNMTTSMAFDVYEKALEVNPDKVLDQAGLSVSNAGLTVSANSALIGLGLQKGDTVLSVNGVSANQLIGDSDAISDIRQSGDASVVVQRGSDTLTLNIKL